MIPISNEFPVKCACGLTNVMTYDFILDRIVVKCECGTVLTIDREKWLEEQIRQEKKR